MKTDLKNFAKELKKLAPDDRLYWLQSMSHCRAISTLSRWPARFYKSFIQLEEDYRHFKGIIVDSLSAVLTDKNKELPVVKKGVDAFMWASDEERKEFCKVVQAVSYRVSAKITNLSDHGKKRIRIHDRKVNAIIVFVPSAEKFIRTRE